MEFKVGDKILCKCESNPQCGASKQVCTIVQIIGAGRPYMIKLDETGREYLCAFKNATIELVQSVDVPGQGELVFPEE